MPEGRRLSAPVRLAALLLVALPLVLPAEPIHVSGRVLAGQGRVEGQIELFPQNGTTPVATAKTDAAGFFELKVPESGCFRARVQASGYASLEKSFLPLAEDTELALSLVPAGDVKPGMEIYGGWVVAGPAPAAMPPPPATPQLVQGTVSNAKGAPVPGALVWSEGSPAIPCVKAGAEGRFQIRLPAGGKARLRATAADHLPSEPREPPSPGKEDAPLVLKLEPAGAITGRVMDAADHPLARVQIEALPVQLDEISTFSAAWSRADGRFRLSSLSPGKLYELRAAQEGFALATMKAGALPRDRPSAPVRIVLERGATAFGRVLDREGKPVRGAELTLDPGNEGMLDGHIVNFQGSVAQITSDPQGGFAFQHLNPGRFRLRVKRKGFAPFALPEIEVQRSARLDLGILTLDPGLAIEGRVTDPRGVPVPEVDVQLSPSVLVFFASEEANFMRKETTDSEGHFRFDDLRRGERFDLNLAVPGYLPAAVRSVEVPAPEPLTIELKRGQTLAGRVTGPAGEPVGNAGLSLWETRVFRTSHGDFPSVGMRPLGVTDRDGSFRVESVAPGLADLEVRARGYRAKRLQDLQVPEDGGVEGLEISLEKADILEIRTLDSQGEPVAGAEVQVREANPQPGGTPVFSRCQTDADGRCRMDDLEPGTLSVIASSEKNAHAETTIEMKTGVNTHDLVFLAGVEVAGRVSDEAGAPVQGASVSLRPPGLGPGLASVSFTDGTFRFASVADGRYRLSGSAPGFAEGSAPGEIQVAGQAVQGLELRLSGGTTLTGRVLGLDPAEVGNVVTFAARVDHSLSQPPTGRVDAQGRYRIEDLGPGTWIVAALMKGHSIQVPLEIAPGIRETVLDLQFPAGFVLSGRVLVDRAPLEGAQVVAAGDGGIFQVLTGSAGSFRISSVPSGHYSLSVFDATRGLIASRTVEVSRDQEVDVEIAKGPPPP